MSRRGPQSKRGESYRRAIEELRALQASARITPPHHPLKRKRTDAYNHAKRRICKQYRISIKTLYRDLHKPVPGLRKRRNDRGKIRRRNYHTLIRKVDELMRAGKTQKDIKSRLKLSEKRMRRARKKIAESDVRPIRSMFGSEAKKFLQKLFQLDLIAPDRGIALHYKGMGITVGREDLKDVCLILANAYNRQCHAEEKKLKVDRSQLRTAMMHHLVEELMQLAKEQADYKLVESLTRMLDRLKEETQLPADFETMVRVCQELKRDIAREEVIALIKKVADEEATYAA